MKRLQQRIEAKATSDGVGVKIHRVAGASLNTWMDPFLMIDEINSDDAADYVGGFPEHPHRGFETITYMKAGRMRHRDHMGNEGVIGAGDVQWMTAGAGVLHSEMPEQQQGLLHGFQLWLNLPAAEKMKPAAYQEIASGDIAEKVLPEGGGVRLIAGDLVVDGENLSGPLPQRSTRPLLADVSLTATQTIDIELSQDQAIMVYVYSGGTVELSQRQLGIYQGAGPLRLAASEAGARLLLLGGKPIGKPVVQYGPFVMNSMEDVERALADYRNGNFI
ncbi:MAG: pirin family protein [Candidatus Pelagadaptatus aseana]|uniref:pirin family protein n=1 Tax=Candidatus Pelagadaptatus aseana TaxID=3120508 RepID=UPI0039B281BD